MDLSFTTEQTMLRDSVTAFLADTYDFEKRHKAVTTSPGWRPQIWQSMARDLGILGACLPDALGGFGGGAVESMILMEEFGRALVVEPFLGTCVIGGGFLKHSGHADAPRIAADIVDGKTTIAFAQAERDSRYNLSAVQTRATANGDAWVLDGHKRAVIGGPAASHLIVTARTVGNSHDRKGIAAFLVDKAAPGISVRDYVGYDGTPMSDISLTNVVVGGSALLGDPIDGLPLIQQVMDEATAALCAEAVGVLRELLVRTIEYTKQRRQFGVPISSFQALQHRMSDMFMDVEQAQSMAWLAAIRVSDPNPAKRAKAVSVAKVQIGCACRRVGQGAIQLHGGMGMTEEMPISHYFKRATVIETLFGSVDHHLERIEALDELVAA